MRFTSVADAAVLAAALLVAILVYALQVRSARSKIRRAQQALAPMFPTPPTDRSGT
jgi:hypothetical protein